LIDGREAQGVGPVHDELTSGVEQWGRQNVERFSA